MPANLRIAFAFVALFFALGLHMPYFPVWLQSRGFSGESVGLVLGVITWMRVVANPFFGRWSDKRGSIKGLAIGLAICTAAAYGLFGIANGLAQTVLVAVALGLTFSPLIPLTDSVALRLGASGRADYGRLRLWGSAAFIAASTVGGLILEYGVEDDILTAVRVTTVVAVFAMLLLPGADTLPPRRVEKADAKPQRSHLVFLVTTGLLHASHAMLYAFGTTHWRSLNVDDTTIGTLWSLGVIAEIGLFLVGGKMQARVGSSGLLAAAAIGGLIRWPLLAVVVWTPGLFGIQALHALTFAATHLGAMAYIQERVADEATATVTTLYSAAAGVGIGIVMLGVGVLYESVGALAYTAMAALSFGGLIGAWALRRQAT